jgi:tetratricopeptide (TPR) repeat protein
MQTRNYRNSVSIEGWQANDGSYPLQEQGGGWVASSKIRLFPNQAAIRVEKPVHELVDYSIDRLQLPVRSLDIPIHHYGYLDADRQRCKQEQYYRLGCEKLRQDGGTDLKSLSELAVQAAELGYYQQAIELWQRVLAIDANFVLAWFNLGYCHLQLGNITQAFDLSQRALALAPNHREAALNAAIAAFCLGNEQIAGELLQAFDRDTNLTAALIRGCLLVCSQEKRSFDEGMTVLNNLQAQGVVMWPFMEGMLEKLQQAGNGARAERLTKALRQLGLLPHQGGER